MGRAVLTTVLDTTVLTTSAPARTGSGAGCEGEGR